MKYIEKPITIEAIQWTGDNVIRVSTFFYDNKAEAVYDSDAKTFIIDTLEGQMKASVGDYIIKGIHGEFYPCKPDIFEETYEPVEDSYVKQRKVIKGWQSFLAFWVAYKCALCKNK